MKGTNSIKKSVKITHIMVRTFYLVLAVAVVASAIICKLLTSYYIVRILVPLWATMPFGAAALVCLDKLMSNIKGEVVFDLKNVKLLNILSILCFIASAIAMVSFAAIIIKDWSTDDFWITCLTHSMFPIMSIGELFVGLIVRVVKSSFESAIVIKAENDLTI